MAVKMGENKGAIVAISELEETIKKLIDFNSSRLGIMTPSSIYVSFEKVENGFQGERSIDFFHQILDSEAPRSCDEVEYGSGPHKPRGVRMVQKGNLSYSSITFRDLIDKISGESPYKKELQSVIGGYGFEDKPIRQIGGTFQGEGLTPKMISFSPGTYKDHVEPWYELFFKSSPNSYQFKINKIVSNGAKDISLWQREIQKDNSLDIFQYFLKKIFIEQGMESCVVETNLGCGKERVFTPNNSNEPLKIPNELAFYTLLVETPYLNLVNKALSLVSSKPQCTIEGKVIVIYLEKGQFVERKEIKVSPLIFDGNVNLKNEAYGLLTSETTRGIIDGLNEFVKSIKGKYQTNNGLGL